MKEINFEDIKEELFEIILERLKINPRNEGKNFTIMDGIFNPNITIPTASSDINRPHTYVPLVIVIENESGVAHFFALFHLMPNLGKPKRIEF